MAALLVLWSACILLLLLQQGPICAQQPAGFISVDCGSVPGSPPYTDPLTGLQFEADNYISTGLIGSVSPEVIASDDLLTLRYFPADSTPKKNCYVVPVQNGTQYLIRAWFLFGDFIQAPESGSIAFQLSIDATWWAGVKVNTSEVSRSHHQEVIVWTAKPFVSICLIRTQDTDTPFINSLELRQIRPTSYLGNFPNPAASLLASPARRNFGEIPGNFFRFPWDEYDRIWPAYVPRQDSTWTSVVAPLYPDQPMVFNLSQQTDYVCSQVMQTAATSPGWMSFTVTPATPLISSTFYVTMSFAELEPLPAGESRVMRVRTNFLRQPSRGDYYVLDLAKIGAAGPYQVFEFGNLMYVLPVSETPSLFFNLSTDPSSTKDPIINAFEAYYVIPVGAGTRTDDVDALTSINLAVGLPQWVGDPCFPIPWDELICTVNRVTGLNLSGKGLTGLIPFNISGLTALTSLDVSNNRFTGLLPTWVAFLPLQTLDVSNNNLNGTFPATYLTTIPTFRYSGNLQLSCQPSSSAICPGSPRPGGTPSSPDSKAPAKSKSKTSIVPIIGGIVGGIVVILIIGALLIFFCPRRPAGLVNVAAISRHGGRGKAQPLTLQAVRAATQDFSDKLGEGGFGPVFLGVLPDKQRVAVKRMSKQSQQGVSEFLNEIDLLSTIHFKKLVSLVGYCQEGPERILLYEFMPGGDLRDRLYAGEKARESPLNWRQRLGIAMDAAKGLEYLHHGCKPAVIHRDVKSGNILLDDRLGAKVADFGLSKLMDEAQSQVMTMVVGTLGYLDPEYNSTGILTEKSDVYSFGVVLLEIFCGHPPISQHGAERKFIVDKVRAAMNTGTVPAIADPVLRGDFKQEAVWRYVDVAMSCVLGSGAARPTMRKVVAELVQTVEMEFGRNERGRNSGHSGSGSNPSPDLNATGVSQTKPNAVDQPSQIFYSREGPQAR